jgi:serine/threonine protein kinase
LAKAIEVSDKGIQCALKFLAGEDGKDFNSESVKQEVSTWIGASGHPNIISVTDAFMHDDFFVIVSEYADGGSLNDWLKKHGDKAPSSQEAVKMMKGILSGLVHLHSKKITHRDLKPDNILLRGGFPCITDFGVSRMLEKTGLHSTKMAGSPFYMSPEAFIGNKAPQTDIWSMGVMFQELLCGYFPFYAENFLL